MSEYSVDMMLDKWDARREIQNIMGKYTYCYLLHREKDIYSMFWSHSDDVFMGFNDGGYKGKEAVAGYFQRADEYNMITGKLLQKALPDKLGDFSDEKLYGVGLQDHKPVSNQIIEVADDLQTAKGLWHCQGKYDRLTAAGPVSYWTWGWFAVDFRVENGEWKVWHLQLVQDIDHPCGYPWGAPEPELEKLDVFREMEGFSMPEPNVKLRLRERYSALRPYTAPPRMPEPYATFAETFSYGL